MAEVFKAGELIDISDTKAASMGLVNTDGLGGFSFVFCTGFARIAPAQSDKELKISQINMIHSGCGMDN